MSDPRHCPSAPMFTPVSRTRSSPPSSMEPASGARHGTMMAAALPRPMNLHSARRYRGINTLALWVAAMNSGYADGLWGTYRQWAAVGARFARANERRPSCSGSSSRQVMTTCQRTSKVPA